MRIRKRTPARAASPGPQPPPPLSASPPQPTEKPQEEEHREAEEEKRAILAAGVRDGREDDDRALAAAAAAAAAASSGNSSSAADDVPKPEPQDSAAAAAARCSRNDGKRWRCKKAAVPGYLFCDRHIAWSTRKRKPKPSLANSKHKSRHGSGVLEPTIAKELELVRDHETPSRLEHRSAGFFDGF